MKEFIINDDKTKQYQRKSMLAFLCFFILIGFAYGSWQWLQHQPAIDGAKAPLRKGLEANETFFTGIFLKDKLVKEYPKTDAVHLPKVNGNAGMNADFDTATWQLQVVKSDGDTLSITLDDIKKLPKKEVVFNFKCIEGWNEITWWGGVSFDVFMKHYGLTKEAAAKYVSMVTPNKEYFVGIDMASALQPQTILCYEMNGKPLPINQGYPLRLIIPVKYGVKHIKRIGTISFANEKPKDYWALRGYDYYTGH